MVQQEKLERENKMIGKWNKPVILSYVGLILSILKIDLLL